MPSGEKLFELLQNYLPTRRCILLVGTGFSIGSKNYQRSELPNVAKLTEILLSQTTISSNEREDFTLNTAIEQYLAEGKNIADLSSLLFNNLHVDLVTEEQKIVANLPWHRIYTTNYDNVIERAISLSHSGTAFDSFDQAGQVEARSPQKLQIIHLHGYILSTNPTDEPNRFVGGIRSYADPSLIDAAWLKELQYDVKNAPAVFVIGQSLRDAHLAQLFSTHSDFHSKTYIISEPTPRKPLELQLKSFGNLFSVGTQKFAELASRVDLKIRSTLPPNSVDLLKFESPKNAVSSSDIERLLLNGYLDRHHIYRQIHGEGGLKYFVERAELRFKEILNKKKRIIFVHSNVGNGKTVFLTELAARFSIAGWNVMQLRPEREQIGDALTFIQNRSTNDVVMVEDIFHYDAVLRAITELSRTNVIFIFTARSSSFEIRHSKIQSDFRGRYIEFDLNELMDNELKNYSEYLDQIGYWRDRASNSTEEKIQYLINRCKKENRSTLLSLLDSPAIKNKLNEYFEKLLALPRPLFEYVVISAYCKQLSSIELDGFELGLIMDRNYSFEIRTRYKDFDREIFLNDFSVQFRSPVFGEYFMREKVADETMLEVISRFVTELDKYVQEQ